LKKIIGLFLSENRILIQLGPIWNFEKSLSSLATNFSSVHCAGELYEIIKVIGSSLAKSIKAQV
jgi:hypothetical protein